MNPGSAVRVRIITTDASHVVKAKIVRCEVTTANGSGLHYKLAIAFDETLDLIDAGDAAAVDARGPSGPEVPMDLLPPDEASTLQFARTPNRW